MVPRRLYRYVLIFFGFLLFTDWMHLRQSELARRGLEAHSGSESSTILPTCNQEARIPHFQEVCRNQSIHHKRKKLAYVVLDHEHKTLGCLISKAGSTAWLRFLVRSKSQDFHKGNARSNDFMGNYSLEIIKGTGYSVVMDKYRDWTKYVVVRHPLQRMVSAYYQAIVRQEKYKKADGSMMSFFEFADALTESELSHNNCHWRLYTRSCQICDVDYAFVAKQETINDDIQAFNERNGVHRDVVLEMKNPNRYLVGAQPDNRQSHYKYDPMLLSYQQRNPQKMRDLIKMYRNDMRLFGYSWDMYLGKSDCRVSTAKEPCC